MSSIPGARFDITGASGSQGLLSPKGSWRAYVLPRGGYAKQDSTGNLITFDSADVASRFAVNNWVQAGLLTGNIRKISAVGGNSVSVAGSRLTVSENDRIFLIGNTQPTVTGGSATYRTPQTVIRERDDSSADIITNSMVTTDSNGLIQFFSESNVFDCLIQDGDQSNQGSLVDLPVGISTSHAVVFGATATFNANIVGTTIHADTVRTSLEPVFNVKHTDYGATGDGSTDDAAAIQSAVDACVAAGGGRVFFPQATYVCDSDISGFSGASNVTVDLNWSVIKSSAGGNPRFVFDGDTGVDGDFSRSPTNCWIVDGTFGDANDTNNKFLGPDFNFCLDCGARNLTKKGKGGTGFNVRRSKRVVLENCKNYGADKDGDNIGFLVWMSEECTIISCHALDGAFIYPFQNKGGYGNRFVSCHVIDVAKDGGTTTPTHAFRDRGDAPWKAAVDSGTYPYASGATWSAADVRRASKDCSFIGCTVRGSTDIVAFLSQESIGTQFVSCTADNAKILGNVNAVANGQERDQLFKGCRGTSLGIAAAVESGGIVINGTTTVNLVGVRVEDCTIEGSYGPGITFSHSPQIRIERNRIKNPGQIDNNTTTDTAGIYGVTANRAHVVGNEVIDDQGTATMKEGIVIDAESSIWPTVKDNYVTGQSNIAIQAWLPGNYGGNRPAEGSGQTTDATLKDDLLRCYLRDNTAVWLEVDAIAMESDASQRAIYKVGGLFYRSGGGVSQQGSDQAFIGPHGGTVSVTGVESEDWTGLSFSTSGNYVRAQVAGLTATTINWRLHPTTREVE